MKKRNGQKGGMKLAAWLAALFVMICAFPGGALGTEFSEAAISEGEGVNQETCNHSYEISYEPDGSYVYAYAKCTKCGYEISQEAQIIASVKAPSCEEGGYTLRTAVFSSPFTTWQEKVDITEATGHNWGEASYNWYSANGSMRCEASRVCKNDPRHVQTEDKGSEMRVDSVGNCLKKGKIVYTVVFSQYGTVTKTVEEFGDHSVIPVAQKDPTCTAQGVASHYECVFCNTLFSDAGNTQTTLEALSIPKTAHQLSAVAAVEPTCTTGGNSAYWVCGTCGKYFSDAAGTSETSTEAVKLPARGHSLSAVAAVEPTCTTGGNIAYWVCGTCGKYFSDAAGTSETSAAAVKLPARGHTLSAVAAVEPTCTTGGNSAYWVCGTCGKYFSDSAGTSETSAEAVKLPAKGHNMTVTGAQLATCTRNGHTTYWTCSNCGQRFGDENGYYPLSESDITIKARGHCGGTAICGAQAVCTVCNQPYGDPGPHPNDQIKTRIVTDPVTGKKVEEEYCELCSKVLSTKTLGKELDSGVFVLENIGATTIGDQASEKIPMRETNEQKIIRQMMEVYTKKMEQIGINPSIINNKKTPWSSYDTQVEYVEAYADERGSYEGGLLH